jgi:hypothetical protein
MRLKGVAVLAVLSTLLGLAHSSASRAATLEGLLMPGDLSLPHAKLESDCSQCHNRADRAQQAKLCGDCHKDVAADIRDRRGFHGRRPEIATAQCSACHSEHNGRKTQLVVMTPGAFDHATTDFKLDGAHPAVSCSDCHRSGKKFREAPQRCVDCHRKAEPHEGKLGTECADCHNTTRWSEVKFDHSKTHFALLARHAQITCVSCHANNKWKDTPTACASCHTPDDVHRGERGAKCGECHTQSSWSDAKFDHEKETGFALDGSHARVGCQGCHRTGKFTDDIPSDCKGCHAAADSHAGRMGNKCETCHDATEWKKTHFDHERDAHFLRQGVHAKLSCHSCHTVSVVDKKPAKECISCHRAVDAHAGTLGKNCENCHGQEAWARDVRFDHDLSSFPLVGQHVAVPCARCHLTQKFKEAPKDCKSCHASDDVHKGGLGKDCAKCHSPNAWNVWQFDHNKESGFPLTGAHEKLQCNTCHRRPAGEFKLGRDCASCHSNDDIHLGQFGRRCDRCHSTISFHRTKPQ